jgi:multicomponent Na+:H+ antiporter subunit G
MSEWYEYLALGLAVVGTALILLASVGVVRMPDFYTRMQTASKASTLGASCILLAAGIHFADAGMFTRAVLIVLFIFLTTPVAAHILARAAYLSRARIDDATHHDDLRGKYDLSEHSLAPTQDSDHPATR